MMGKAGGKGPARSEGEEDLTDSSRPGARDVGGL